MQWKMFGKIVKLEILQIICTFWNLIKFKTDTNWSIFHTIQDFLDVIQLSIIDFLAPLTSHHISHFIFSPTELMSIMMGKYICRPVNWWHFNHNVDPFLLSGHKIFIIRALDLPSHTRIMDGSRGWVEVAEWLWTYSTHFIDPNRVVAEVRKATKTTGPKKGKFLLSRYDNIITWNEWIIHEGGNWCV